MVDIIKQDMTDIWAVAGDVVAPDSAKVRAGWAVEAVPRQWWNWFENRQDTNIAYMLQKGIPEWDQFTEYLTNKSYVQRNNVVYKCILTGVNQDPATATLYWVKAFPESSAYLEVIRPLAVSNNTTQYIDGAGTAQNTDITAYGRSVLNTADAAALRTLSNAQVAHTNLTALSGVVAAANALPYFTGTTAMGTTVLTAFGRSLIDDVDAATARATLEVDSAATVAANLTAGLATKQPLDATLTALAGVAATLNTLPYFNGTDTATVTPLTAYARSLLDDVDAPAARATLSVYSIADSDSNLTAGLATRQPLDATLTALAGLATGINQLPYSTGTDTFAQTALTAFARSILDDADAVTVRATIGADDASNLTTGTLPLARIPANLTGKNAATATALQTPRAIQGVPFDGTANITLSVVDKDSGVGSASLPAGTTAQRTASPVNGQLRYNSDNNEFEGYINGSWGGIGGGTPLFTVLWWPSRTAIPAGYVAADGVLLTRSTYSAAWARVNAGDVPVVSDAAWVATSTSRGCYTAGNGTTTFRIPDLNGKTSGTLAAPFLRGDGINSTGVAGQFQGSDNLAHSHGWAAGQAAARNTYPATVGWDFTKLGAGYYDISTSPVIANSGGVEARPVNVTGVFIIKLIGGASDLTQEDASVAVAALENKLAAVSGRNRVINGDCRVAQRGSAVVTGTVNLWGGPDRYRATMQAAGGQFTQTLSSFGDLNGVNRNWVAQTCNTSATNLAGTNYWSGIAHAIEGTNCFDLRGKPVSMSFLFRSNITGVFSVAFRDASTWSYVTTFSVVANTTTKVVINIPAIPLAANVPANNGIGLQINIGALNNGTFNTATMNAWQNATYLAANAATQWQATPGTYIAVTDLQLEEGMDTVFERIPYSDQLARCQRYYEVVPGTVNNGQGIYVWRYYKVSKRAVPTLTSSGSFGGGNLESSSDTGFRLGGTPPTFDADFIVYADSEL